MCGDGDDPVKKSYPALDFARPLCWLFGMKYTKRIPEVKETTA